MEAADVLYGVTMGPDGVSQVVSPAAASSRASVSAARLRGRVAGPLSLTWAELLGDEPTAADEPERTGLFSRMRESLAKSRRALTSSSRTPRSTRPTEAWERLEEALIRSDVGVPATAELVRRLEAKGVRVTRGRRSSRRWRRCSAAADLDLAAKPSVVLVVGVNGTGKTTTIGKLALKLPEHGRSVLVGAADTFRAAAEEQLEIWAERAGADFVGAPRGADPAAVAFDALEAAPARGRDVVIVDTAGPPAHPDEPHGRAREGPAGHLQSRRRARRTRRCSSSTRRRGRTACSRRGCSATRSA